MSAGIPFDRLLHMEARKIVDTRSGRGLLAAIAALALLGAGLNVKFAAPAELGVAAMLGFAAMPLMLLLPVLGILTATAESTQRTGMVTFVVEPRRWRVVAAKALAAVLAALVLLVVALLGSVLFHVLAMALRGAPADFALPWAVVGGCTLTAILSVLQGVALGTLLRSSPLAIVVYFALPFVVTIGTSVVSGLDRVRDWLDLTTSTAPLMVGRFTGETLAHLATSSLLWVVAPLVLGAWVLSRREIA